jgi:hypothetical protein
MHRSRAFWRWLSLNDWRFLSRISDSPASDLGEARESMNLAADGAHDVLDLNASNQQGVGNERARDSALNRGLCRERGIVRTSATSRTPCARSKLMNSSIARVEWPIVRMIIGGSGADILFPFIRGAGPSCQPFPAHPVHRFLSMQTRQYFDRLFAQRLRSFASHCRGCFASGSGWCTIVLELGEQFEVVVHCVLVGYFNLLFPSVPALRRLL